MNARNFNRVVIEEIPLYRAGNSVSGFLNAFGNALKEIRVTGTLGYILSLCPEKFRDIFSLNGKISEITLEANHGNGRSDIRIQTADGKVCVIEAKLPTVDPYAQVSKYVADWKVLLTNFPPTKKKESGVTYVSWQQLGDCLNEISRSKNYLIRAHSIEFLKYLEEYGMIARDDSNEIYDREINEESTLTLFLKARLYACEFKKGRRFSGVGYFAPHFGKQLVLQYPGVGYGISYVSRIDSVEVVESSRAFTDLVAKRRGKKWNKDHLKYLRGFSKTYPWPPGEKRTILFLGPPRLVFNPPVTKKYLQKGSGWLSKNYLSFDQLFRAWHREKIYEVEK